MSEPFDPDKTTMFSTPSAKPPGPGWWLADDGEWYPPETPPGHSESPGPGYWMASDGRWYPPSPDETTVIKPVPTPNQYQAWEPQPQPHDAMSHTEEAQGSASRATSTSGAAATRDELDVPAWAKVIGAALVLLFIAAMAITALDISI